MAINTFLIWLLHLPWGKVRTLVSPMFSKGLSSNSSSVVNWQTVLCLKCSSVNIQYHLWIAGIFIVKSMGQKKSDCRWHWSLLPFALWKDTIITTKLQEAWGEQGHLVLCHLFKLPISVTMEESSYLPFNFIVFGGYYAISLSLKFLFFVRSCLYMCFLSSFQNVSFSNLSWNPLWKFYVCSMESAGVIYKATFKTSQLDS